MPSQQIEIQFLFVRLSSWDASLASIIVANTPAQPAEQPLFMLAISIWQSPTLADYFFFVFEAVLYLNLQCACNEWLCHAIC